MQPKYLFVTGGVISSLGKGLAMASLGALLEARDLRIACLKIDPYLNVDPGTMNPFQHGEVYVTDDGAETDLDLGHYSRFTNAPLTQLASVTSGQVYNEVLRRERKGEYLGQTVQVIPHVTDQIKRSILAVEEQHKDLDMILVEVGGTVGDIESLPILEAIRQFRQQRPDRCFYMHVTYVPYLESAGETKTKPTQHSVHTLRGIGIIPDMILCRCQHELSEEIKDKISLFCSVRKEAVIEARDVDKTIYELPLKLHEQRVDELICHMFGFYCGPIDLSPWQDIVDTVSKPKGTVTVGVIGKYVKHQDAYKSLYEALVHGALALGYTVEIKTFEADKVLRDAPIHETLTGCDGYLVPGGFGERGWLGKIAAVRHCREKKIPYFGICLGMQAMVVEYARNVAGLAEANSTEVDPGSADPVISLLIEQEGVEDLGGTMRLGAYPCVLKPGSKIAQVYGEGKISERHRHRYEFNNKYADKLEKLGLNLSGRYEERQLVEVAEIEDHPWMIGVQYHPEFKSKPTAPHPLFKSFVQALIDAKSRKDG